VSLWYSTPMRYESPKERFWSKVSKGSGCWLWTAAMSDGYGVFWFEGRTTPAHRWAFEQENGAIPSAAIVRHHCDNPACVRPDHLRVGTHGDNVRDRDQRERQAKGEMNGRAKLSMGQVRSIRARFASGDSQVGLAREFGVSRRTVSMIVHRETWRHV
jgi:hypothetical protein